jgi:hypothetical protein
MWSRAGDHEQAVQYIERAHRERALGLVYLAVQPDFELVWNDPRVRAVLEAMKLSGVVDRRRK